MSKKNRQKSFFATYTLSLVLGLCNLVVIGSLLLFMTHTDNQSTNIANDANAIQQLTIKNQLLEDAIASSQSMSVVDQKAQQLGMQPSNNIIYLTTSNALSYNVGK
jgi:hypothetical protein